MGFSLSLSLFHLFYYKNSRKKGKQTTYRLTFPFFWVLISYLVSLLFSPSSSATSPSTSCTKRTHIYKYPYEGFKSQYQQMVLPIIRPYIGWYGKKWPTRWKCKALECKYIKERKLKLLSILICTNQTHLWSRRGNPTGLCTPDQEVSIGRLGGGLIWKRIGRLTRTSVAFLLWWLLHQ